MPESKPAVILSTVIIYSPDIERLARFYQEGLALGPPTASGTDHWGYQLPNLYLGFDVADEMTTSISRRRFFPRFNGRLAAKYLSSWAMTLQKTAEGLAPNCTSAQNSISLWFEVADLTATFNHLVAMGATIRYPPVEKPWGARLAALFDPEGNIIGLAQSPRQD